jgi:hypothetical protein
MRAAELNRIYTIPGCFLLEKPGKFRHEFIDGYLFEMSGASRELHKICKKPFKVIGKGDWNMASHTK